jgi:hypothetical protein
MGQISPVDAYLRLNPGTTEEQAIKKLAEIAEVKKIVSAAATPPALRPFTGNPPPTPPAPGEESVNPDDLAPPTGEAIPF